MAAAPTLESVKALTVRSSDPSSIVRFQACVWAGDE